MKNHQWWFRFSYTDETINDFFRISLATPPGSPVQNVQLFDIKRSYFSLTLQDQIELTDTLTLTASMRFNHREDLQKDFFSPRIAAVWRLSDNHTLKAQYAEGYRVPTFFELYSLGNKADLKQVTIATSEVSYIYHQADYTGKITLFYSEVEDMITPDRPDFFVNGAKAESFGVEAEWEHQLTDQLKWQANLSYINSSSTRGVDNRENADPASTNWLSNVAVLYRPFDQIVLSAHWNYTGRRLGLGNTLDPEHSLNLTASVFDVFAKGLDFKLGIRNTLNEDEKYVQTGPLRNNPVIDYQNQALIWAQFSYHM